MQASSDLLFNRYIPLETLGQGAQGIVLKVKDILCNEIVVLKTLIKSNSPKWNALFKSEFEILAGLSHPRLVRVYDFGTFDGDKIYFTRDFVGGIELLKAVKNPTIDDIIHLSVEICQSIRPLHYSGLRHSDIKPGNIIVNPDLLKNKDFKSGYPVSLIDFSFVHQIESPAQARGTLPYMAPELFTGDLADHRADLYSLGITLYQLCCGCLPMDPDSHNIVKWHKSALRPLPCCSVVKNKTEQDKKVTQEFVQIIHKLISISPDDRFIDIDELEAALSSLSRISISDDIDSRLPGKNVMIRKEIVDELTHKITDTVDKEEEYSPLFAVLGEAGSGRNALFKTVKWNFQLKGWRIIESDFSKESNLDSLIFTLSKAIKIWSFASAASSDHSLAPLLDSVLSYKDLPANGHLLGTMVCELAQGLPVLVLFENIDKAPTNYIDFLRGFVAGINGKNVAIMVSVQENYQWNELPGIKSAVTIPPYSISKIQEVVKTYIGDLCPEDIDAIMDYTRGNPLLVTNLLIRAVETGKMPSSIISESTTPSAIEKDFLERISQLNKTEKAVLEAVAIVDRPLLLDEIEMVSQVESLSLSKIKKILLQRLLTGVLQRYEISSRALRDVVIENIKPSDLQNYNKFAFKIALDPREKLLNAIYSQNIKYVNTNWYEVFVSLEKSGNLLMAQKVLSLLLDVELPLVQKYQVLLYLGRVQYKMGQPLQARQRLLGLTDIPNKKIKFEVLRLLAQISSALEQYEKAKDFFLMALDIQKQCFFDTDIYYELCEFEFKSGRYIESINIVDTALLNNPGKEKIAPLLTSKARSLASLGNLDTALELAQKAIEAARTNEDLQARAFAHDVKSWILERLGKHATASDELKKAISLYRQFGAIPRLVRSLAALGNIYYWLEQWSKMLKYHEEAARLSVSLENAAQRNELTIILGYSLICMGRFERAFYLFEKALAEAHRIDNKDQVLKILIYKGDICVGKGDFDGALKHWKQGYDGLASTSNNSLRAELAIEMAQIYISKGGNENLDLAKSFLNSAKNFPKEDKGRNFDFLYKLTRGQLLLAHGSFKEGMLELDSLVEALTNKNNKNIQWQAHFYMALELFNKGSYMMAKVRIREAKRLLYLLSGDLPARHQDAFWQDTKREQVKKLDKQISKLCASQSTDLSSVFDTSSLPGETKILYKILEFNKQIALESDIDLIMEKILEAATELTSANFGLILMPVEGKLTVIKSLCGDEDRKTDIINSFSRSVAESVFLDAQPVITADALSDNRFSEFLSIHHFQVKSVICVPMICLNETLGVIYLENRLDKGLFGNKDLRLLSAFANQNAIAISFANTRRVLEETNKKLNEVSSNLQVANFCSTASPALFNENKTGITTENFSSYENKEFNKLIGKSKKILEIQGTVEKVKNLDVPVIISGPTGTGKDLVAKMIHNLGNRKEGPFVAFNCSQVPETLLEATFFGYKKGAFTGAGKDHAGLFQLASSGTLYLDGIEDISFKMQIMLLRILEENVFVPLGSAKQIRTNFRLICSSNVEPAVLLSKAIIRSDLYYRLVVITISMPPLNDRIEDIALLTDHFLKEEALTLNRPVPRLTRNALNKLLSFEFKGNVRQLQQLLKRAYLMNQDKDILTENMLFPEIKKHLTLPVYTQNDALCEKQMILDAISKCGGNKSKAAQLLKIPRRTFYRRIKKMNIE